MSTAGIPRDADVLKALALGARAGLVGRPYLWGLAADVEAGARRVLEILREELRGRSSIRPRADRARGEGFDRVEDIGIRSPSSSSKGVGDEARRFLSSNQSPTTACRDARTGGKRRIRQERVRAAHRL
ncbi:MAG: hypothetical protein DMG07_03365 [Acidobacteria bacterium]|nr:MAG: hypothetical protein DMG07_03365 [Acidobacteriota bacterium]